MLIRKQRTQEKALLNHKLIVCAVTMAFTFMGVAFLQGKAAAQITPQERARDVVDSVKHNFDSPEALEQNGSRPLTDSASMMTSFDGNSSFSSPVSCQSTSNYLDMFFAPSGSGDISPINVQQDTDFDGVYDQLFSVPFPVSGVCADGVISCAPGTWNGCQSYKWSTNAASGIELVNAPLTEMSACTCVNNSCGSGLVTMNEASLGGTLSSGMAAVLMQRDARYAVTAVSQTPFQITLAGQDTTACQSSAPLTQTQYSDDLPQLILDGQNEASTDPTYNILTNLTNVSGTSLSRNSCSINRNVSIPTTFSSSVTADNDGNRIVINQDTVDVTLGDIALESFYSSSCAYETRTTTIQVSDPSSLDSVLFYAAHGDDHFQVHVDGNHIYSSASPWTSLTGPHPGSCQVSSNPVELTPNIDLTSIFADGQPHEVRVRIAYDSHGELYSAIRFRGSSCNVSETIADSCAGFHVDNNCRIVDETVDGIVTMSNGVTTGLTSLPSTRNIVNGSCNVPVTNPWWNRDRVYECVVNGANATTEPNLDRFTYIYDNSTSATFSDQTTDATGNVTTSTGNLNAPSFYTFSDCEESCKVSTDISAPQVTVDGVTTDLRVNPDNTVFKFLGCTDNICPVGPGETVVTPCACTNEFPTAVALMQSLRMGGFDQICTTGVEVGR